ncbi:hypothetical protein CANARDRAFT_6482 [[Candida] arabinofermentans NRRL YB-2248]|uniref:N-acetyltransferase domain-containing protein n=1 Tax=[Candida] arabinofermentans NRRL YB-2248 TaxID=983967 RepID=A0A1E4T5A9_9ASCO|nr:hypothetical protein CANARDRAFT_6482 [[Candida] arabinofermentans NRRL YB-2248]
MAVAEELRIYELITKTLKDGTVATVLPFNSIDECPSQLFEIAHQQYNMEVATGQTLAQVEPLTVEEFKEYYFPGFTAFMLLGTHTLQSIKQLDNFDDLFLGCFYIKPNYLGRSSHNCNGAFLVNNQARGKSVGSKLGECYLYYAPKLGFRYSVFNLVYETNVASSKIWDGLGFERIGRVKGAGNLKGLGYVDAIMFGYDFTK